MRTRRVEGVWSDAGPGTATEQFCIGGLLYNEETHACDWPQNVAGCQKHRECKRNTTLQ